MSTLRITNATRGSIIATHATIANDPQMRRQGLIGMTAYEFQPAPSLPRQASAISRKAKRILRDMWT